MTKKFDSRSHRGAWRLLLLMLVMLPFSPEITIYALATLAKARGCALDNVCPLGNAPLSYIVDAALQAGLFVSLGFGIGFAAAWLALCYYTISRGWSRMTSRLMLAFAISTVFAVLPYEAPNLALAYVANPKCPATEGRVGPCFIFGGDVTNTADDVVAVSITPFFATVVISQKFPITANFISKKPVGPMALGAPIAAGAFFIYAILTIVVRTVSRRRAAHASAN